MDLLHNPKHLGDREQAWKSFLIGSLVTSSFIYFVLTESVFVFFSSIGLMIIGFLLFVDTNMGLGKRVYLSQNIFFIVIGGLISLISHATGLLFFYLGIIVILVLVTWLHKFKTKGRVTSS